MIEDFKVSPDGGVQRLDVFLAENTQLTRSGIKNLIQQGMVTVNAKPAKAGQKLAAGDMVRMEVPSAKPVDLAPQDIPLDIVYQDGDIAVINKARGMVVHPAVGNQDGTLVNALLYQLGDLSGINGEIRRASCTGWTKKRPACW